MKIKHLKELLEGVDENFDVIITDVADKGLQLVGGGELCGGNICLNVRQEYPDSWFDERGIEVRWVHGKRVELCFDDMEDEVYLHIYGQPSDEPIKVKMHDGYAEGANGLLVAYPKLEDLTDLQLEEMDKDLGNRISTSGFVGFDDVCVMYGKVEVEPVKRLDHDSNLICESVQEITLIAWPKIYGKDNPHDLDGSVLLSELRRWGEEFESWWMSHSEQWTCEHDYLVEIEKFAEEKASEYLESLK